MKSNLLFSFDTVIAYKTILAKYQSSTNILTRNLEFAVSPSHLTHQGYYKIITRIHIHTSTDR
jgi:hypothetical protein